MVTTIGTCTQAYLFMLCYACCLCVLRVMSMQGIAECGQRAPAHSMCHNCYLRVLPNVAWATRTVHAAAAAGGQAVLSNI